jgi:hypothetical protein
MKRNVRVNENGWSSEVQYEYLNKIWGIFRKGIFFSDPDAELRFLRRGLPREGPN